MARIRTFIAIDPGKAIHDRIIALQETLARTGAEVKWVEPTNLHLTLLFLGEVDEREIPPVCQAVADVTAKQMAFSMTVESAGCFPNSRRPRVLWVGISTGSQEVCTLHDALELPLLELGCYRREDRKYTPHITLGRIKTDPGTDQLAAALAKNVAWKGGDTTVREVHVMSSKLSPQGPEYTVLSRAKLA
jgi:2'-5' RNA ligase